MLNELKEVREMRREVLIYSSHYKRAKTRLRKLINEQVACINAGYIQHYPEYSEMIGESKVHLKTLRRQIVTNCNLIKTKLNKGIL